MTSQAQAQLPQSQSLDQVHEDTFSTEIHGTHYANLKVVQVTSNGMPLYHIIPKSETVRCIEVPIYL
jgi:hypothetical protein